MKQRILSIILLMGLMQPIFAMQDLSSDDNEAREKSCVVSIISLFGLVGLTTCVLTIAYSAPSTEVTNLTYNANATLPVNTNICTYNFEPCDSRGIIDFDECRRFCEENGLGTEECFIQQTCKKGNKETLTTGSFCLIAQVFTSIFAAVGWNKAWKNNKR